MSKIDVKNENCLRGGCVRWRGAVSAGLTFTACERCGFDKQEADRRMKIPLTLCRDGLKRKLIPPSPKKDTVDVEENDDEDEE